MEDCTWTFSDGQLVLELSKKAATWWLSAVKGGCLGPGPKERREDGPGMKLDAKIGEQVVSKKAYEGKSQFQW